MLKDPTFHSFASFLIVLLTPFTNKPRSSRDLIIFIISSISSFEIINFVRFAKFKRCILDPRIFYVFLCLLLMLLMLILMLLKHWCKFFMKIKLVFCNNSRRIPRNIPNCNLLDRLVFDHFVLADELFAKALKSLETC